MKLQFKWMALVGTLALGSVFALASEGCSSSSTSGVNPSCTATGDTCAADSDCCSASCVSGVCAAAAACTAEGAACTSSGECCTGLDCTGGVCTGTAVGDSGTDASIPPLPAVDSGAGDPGCRECIADSCDDVWAICELDPNCLDIYFCAIAAATSDDVTTCICVGTAGDSTNQSQEEYLDLAACDLGAACTGGSCDSECSGSVSADYCDAFGNGAAVPTASVLCPNDPTPDDYDASFGDCSTCAVANCGTELAACPSTGTTDCDDYNACVEGCADNTCVGTCQDAYADGYDDQKALDTCLEASCADECGP